LRIDEVNDVYEPSRVDAEITADGQVDVVTFNVNALRLAREAGDTAILDGTELPCRSAADGLLPDVWYVRSTDGWDVLSYDESLAFLENPQRRKRHGLQGPIDDAFLSSFVCVEGTQPAWSEAQHAWARWTLSRFTREFDSWMRGVVPVVKDDQVTEDMIAQSNLVLFGDPGSNLMIARILDQLPVTWTKDEICIGERSWSTSSHGLSLIFPNPLNPSRYVVINSGHTMHDADFRASNAWLFPRLGDIAVQKVMPRADGGYEETIEWATNFNSEWELP
ncbi:MAG: hypothetical protein KDA85_15915, partial [Planctomycetaceae bacterium]|nr:hypothetical protein [Planctomycetaceae bacterium]